MSTTNKKKYLITVIGPTAIGKTAMAIHIANYFNTSIISADSRQFFKEMAIGTAVPNKEEQEAAKHHFIQNISIFDEYSVGDFEREAIDLLDSLHKEQDFVVMAGGSGLYVDAILKGFDEFPDIEPSIREDLIAEYESNGITYLQNKLKELDPTHYERVAKDNPQRMMRALEVCIGTGKPYSSFLNQKKNNRNFIPIVIGLETDREIMYNRINMRVDIMVNNGLIEEAEALYKHKNLNALQTVGYKELFRYFEGELTKEEAIEEIKKNTRRFAKRQMTWFRRNEAAKWFDYQTSPSTIINYIKDII